MLPVFQTYYTTEISNYKKKKKKAPHTTAFHNRAVTKKENFFFPFALIFLLSNSVFISYRGNSHSATGFIHETVLVCV